MKRLSILILLVLFSGVIFFVFGEKDKTKTPSVVIRGKTFAVEIADSNEERTKGLSKRNSLAKDKGMLFIFEKPGLYSFWMKDTLIPLDIIFVKDNKIVTIHHNVQPQPNIPDAQLLTYAPSESINYVLEVNGGLSQEYGFNEGDEVVYDNLGN